MAGRDPRRVGEPRACHRRERERKPCRRPQRLHTAPASHRHPELGGHRGVHARRLAHHRPGVRRRRSLRRRRVLGARLRPGPGGGRCPRAVGPRARSAATPLEGPVRGAGVMAIFLIRHGETEGNASRIVQRPDNPLSARGVVQAERLARRLAHDGIAHIVSSDLARAVTTAEQLRRATGVPLSFEPLLQERSFGDLRGTPYAELGFDMFAADYGPAGGGALAIFRVRGDRAVARVQALAATAGGQLAVVTHGLVWRSLGPPPLILPDREEVAPRWENTSLTIVD